MQEHSVTSTRCLVLDDSVIYAEAIGQILGSEPAMEVHTSATGFGEGVRAARRLHPDVIIIAGDTPGVASVVESLDSAVPEAPIIVVFGGDEPALARECELAGAQRCLYDLYDGGELVLTIRRLVARERRRRAQIVARAQGGQPRLARVVAFHSAKGGTGTTTMLVNAAVALRKLSGRRVAIVDGAMQSGDVGVLLDIDHSSNITDLIAHLAELDGDLVDEVMAPHASGVQVLLAPPEIERAELLTPDQFVKILGVLRKSVDYVLVDTSSTLDGVSMAALDAADQIVLVSTPEVPALRNTARFMQLAAKLGYPPEKLFLLLNRAGSRSAVATADVKQHLKTEIGLTMPSAGRSMVAAVNKGAPAAMEHGRWGPAKQFRQLAHVIESSELTSKRQARARRAAWLRRDREGGQSPAESTPA